MLCIISVYKHGVKWFQCIWNFIVRCGRRFSSCVVRLAGQVSRTSSPSTCWFCSSSRSQIFTRICSKPVSAVLIKGCSLSNWICLWSLRPWLCILAVLSCHRLSCQALLGKKWLNFKSLSSDSQRATHHMYYVYLQCFYYLFC